MGWRSFCSPLPRVRSRGGKAQTSGGGEEAPERQKDMSGGGGGGGSHYYSHACTIYSGSPPPLPAHPHRGETTGTGGPSDTFPTWMFPIQRSEELQRGLQLPPPTGTFTQPECCSVSPPQRAKFISEHISHLYAAEASCVTTQRCRSGRTRGYNSLGGTRGAHSFRHFHLFLPARDYK